MLPIFNTLKNAHKFLDEFKLTLLHFMYCYNKGVDFSDGKVLYFIYKNCYSCFSFFSARSRLMRANKTLLCSRIEVIPTSSGGGAPALGENGFLMGSVIATHYFRREASRFGG